MFLDKERIHTLFSAWFWLLLCIDAVSYPLDVSRVVCRLQFSSLLRWRVVHQILIFLDEAGVGFGARVFAQFFGVCLRRDFFEPHVHSGRRVCV